MVVTLVVLAVFNPFTNPRYMFLGADLAILASWVPVRRRSLIGLADACTHLHLLRAAVDQGGLQPEAFSREASKDTKDYLVSTEFDAFNSR